MRFLSLCFLLALPLSARASDAPSNPRHTSVSIVGDEFYINGQPTYAGRAWHGHKLQGLLLNARLVQGIFDDRNTNTLSWWSYTDTGKSNKSCGLKPCAAGYDSGCIRAAGD